MRQDKLTTKFQEALADAQSIAVGADHQYIEPLHVLAAMLRQSDGGARSLLARAGANVGAMTAAVDNALKGLPQVTGTDGQVQIGRELVTVLNQADKEAQSAATPTSPARCSCWRWPTTRGWPAARRASTG